MKSLFKPAKNEETFLGNSLAEVEKILETPVQETPQYRYVKLRAETCCGCGCSEIVIGRQVDYDSPLKNGDYVGSDIRDTDDIL